jgi:hypothetical protein
MHKKNLFLAAILFLITGCDLGPNEATISLAVNCSDDTVNSYQATCFIKDISGSSLDTKKFIIDRDKNEFWTRHSFSVPRKSIVELSLIGKNSSNMLFKAESEVNVAKESKKTVYLSLEQPKAEVENQSKETVKVSGTINSPGYSGKIEINISTKEAQKKVKYRGDFPPLAAKTIIDYSGEVVYFNLDLPANLGPSVICFFRLQNEEPPFCQDIDIGATDVQGIVFQR